MKVTYWNAKGFGNSLTQMKFRSLCRDHNPLVVAIVETTVNFSSISLVFWNYLKLSFVANFPRGSVDSL